MFKSSLISLRCSTLLFSLFFLAFPLSEIEGKGRIRDNIKAPPKQHKPPFGEKDHLLMINPHHEETYTGMFSVFNYVVGCLDLFEQEVYGGISLDFGQRGLYYDQAKGTNWWSYYCEPIFAGKEGNKVTHSIWGDAARIIYHTECDLPKERVYELINKYIQFKPDVLEAVDQFCKEYFFTRPVIGVHYRGTDKESEAKRVAYAAIKGHVNRYIDENALDDFLIFVATDEELFVDYMIEQFPEHIIFIPAERSTDGTPLHLSTKKPYQQGFESLLDCILLSKTDFLIRTSSNLSLWSTYLNPKLPNIVLNQRHRY